MVLSVAEMVLPIMLLLAVGVFCRKKAILTPDGLAGIRSIVGNICLPVVLFNAFFTARYSSAMLLTFAAVYLGFGAALLAGFALRRIAAPHERFFPFLLSSAEGGMLGYALYGVLTGEQSGFGANGVRLHDFSGDTDFGGWPEVHGPKAGAYNHHE